MLYWNKARWFAVPSSMIMINQSECFISELWSYAAEKGVYDISSVMLTLSSYENMFPA